MFEINNTKTFKDSVHGYINVPKCFVESLMDNEYFQRLRNIEQTGMRVLYPNAKHDRFSHSLGVFHLGQRAVDDLLDNFSKDPYWNIESDAQSIIFWAKNKVLFLIACLLHDIGHAPFSHALENEVLHNSKKPIEKKKGKKKSVSSKVEEGDYITYSLNKTICESEKAYSLLKYGESYEDKKMDFSRVAAHEQLGASLILNEFFSCKIAEIFKHLNKAGFPRPEGESILYSEYYDDKIVLDDINLDDESSKIIFFDDLCFIARMIMGLKYDDWHPERQIRNCFIELLNGENFDVDKLDYIVRDTLMSGINNISVDVDRLLNSLCIVTKTKHFDKRNVSYEKLPQMTIVNIKNKESENEICIHGELQGHIIVKKGSTVTIYEKSKFELISGVNENMAKIHYLDANIAKFHVDTRVYQDSELILPDEDGDKKVIQLRGKGGKKSFDASIKNALLLNDFCFSVDEDINLLLHETCKIKIKGAFYSKKPIRVFTAESLTGSISEVEILDDSFKHDYIKEKVPNKNSYNTFSIGFKKNAINVIANVMDARNYLYLWIYAHHKVIYYANFLIPVLARELFPKKTTNEFPNWSLDFDNIKYLDDAYLWTVIKYQYCKNALSNSAKNKELKELLDELFTRNYKTSLYKSLAEYDLFFEKYSRKIKNDIKNHISTKLIEQKKLPNIEGKNKNGKKSYNVGYFKKSEISTINREIKNLIMSLPEEEKKYIASNLEIKDILFVSAEYKMKQLETFTTFVDMKDDWVAISQIPLLESQSRKSEDNSTNPYFYLYYQTVSSVDKNKENEIIKDAMKNYFENIVATKSKNISL